MQVMRKKPGERWELVKIDNTLEALQKEVGGYIETISCASDACFIVNEEGIIKNLPFNTRIAGLKIYGTVLLVGVNGDEFTDVPVEAVRLFTEGRRKKNG